MFKSFPANIAARYSLPKSWGAIATHEPRHCILDDRGKHTLSIGPGTNLRDGALVPRGQAQHRSADEFLDQSDLLGDVLVGRKDLREEIEKARRPWVELKTEQVGEARPVRGRVLMLDDAARAHLYERSGEDNARRCVGEEAGRAEEIFR
jgi:hypothetical protein